MDIEVAVDLSDCSYSDCNMKLLPLDVSIAKQICVDWALHRSQMIRQRFLTEMQTQETEKVKRIGLIFDFNS